MVMFHILKEQGLLCFGLLCLYQCQCHSIWQVADCSRSMKLFFLVLSDEIQN